MEIWERMTKIQTDRKNESSKKQEEKRLQAGRILESIFVVILMLYPLRHIHWGLDLWDTGYSYANFQYMGLEHMDSMWLFSTYFANVVGHFLTKLPGASILVGMNLYTGLFVSGLSLAGYLFSNRKLQIPAWVAFLGEFAAISLCWCPTAKLYDYLTYVLFLACVILLYQGLTRDRMGYLFAAGVCLGTNVLVRFSNLPEAAMIVAVWAYAYLVSREEKKCRNEQEENCGGQLKEKMQRGKQAQKHKGAWALGFRHTLWCLGGYLCALFLFFGYIHIRYGMDNYVESIGRLFAMTDNATDYKATSMVMSIVGTYVENLYWVIRILIIGLIGMVACIVADSLAKTMRAVVTEQSGFVAKHPKLSAKLDLMARLLGWMVRVFCVLLAAAMLLWLYGVLNKEVRFCSFYFYSYDPILRPAILFLMLILFIALVRIFYPGVSKDEKLISGLVFLVVLLTSVGSNNKLFPSFNNLFLAAPYALWECYRFFRNVKQCRVWKLVISAFPVKCILAAFLAMCFFQFTMFGVNFVFEEATGVQNPTATVKNNEILKGIKMNPERARWMTEISAYVNENDLQGREVILYGGIPSLSYYLQMPPAFNSWSDLLSYSPKQMLLALEKISSEIEAAVDGGTVPGDVAVSVRPVIILESSYGTYMEGGRTALEELGIAENKVNAMEQDEKWQMLVGFMEKHGYQQTFANEKFVIME